MANGWLCILKNTRKNGLQQKSKDVGSVKKQSKTWLVLIIVCMAVVLFMGFLVYRHNEEPQMHEISVMENREDELVFAVSLDEYIERFNRYYRADYRKITCCRRLSGILKHIVRGFIPVMRLSAMIFPKTRPCGHCRL